MLTKIPGIYKKLSRAQWVGIFLAVSALSCGLLLVSCSAWFITATALTGLGIIGLQGYNIFLPSSVIRFLALARPVNKYFENRYTHRVTLDKLSLARAWVFDKILMFKKAELVKFRSSRLLSELINDLEDMDQLYQAVILPWITAAILFLLAGSVAYFLLPTVAVLLAGLFSIAGVIIPYLSFRATTGPEEESLLIRRQAHIDIMTWLRGFRDLRQFGLLNGNRMLIESKLVCEQYIRSASKMKLASWQLLQQFILQLGLIAIIFLAEKQRGQIEMTTIVLIVVTWLALAEILYLLPAAAQQLSRTNWSGNSLAEWDKTKDTTLAENLSLPAIYDLEVKNVNVAYKGRDVLTDFNFKFQAGLITAVTGCNGSGKTTLLDMLSGLRCPDSGIAGINGKAAHFFNPEQLNNHIAYMEQHATLFNVSLFENIALARTDATEREVKDAAIRAGLGPEILHNPQFLYNIAGESGKNISGGQSRMIALARIILKDSPVLLLDEPTEGLDTKSEANFIKLLTSWKGKKTVIIVTHKRSLILLADCQCHLD
jgi:ATP-binding cassette, subfamily C, bacterial CydC